MGGVLALITGWALLSPLLVLLFARLSGHYWPWMEVFLGIAASAPLLIFLSLGGILVIGFGVRSLARQSEPRGPY